MKLTTQKYRHREGTGRNFLRVVSTCYFSAAFEMKGSTSRCRTGGVQGKLCAAVYAGRVATSTTTTKSTVESRCDNSEVDLQCYVTANVVSS